MIKDRLAELKAVQPQEQEDAVTVTFTQSDDSLSTFYREVDDISKAIDCITENVKKVVRLHSSLITTPRPTEKMKQELEDLTSEIRRTATKVRNRLKVMDMEVEKSDNKGSAEYRIKKTQQSTLEHAIVQAMTDYNAKQNEYRDKCKQRIQRQLEITGRSTTDEEVEEMLEQGDPAVFTQGILTDTQQARQTLADIEARHEEIMKLEKSIMEVHALFVDMATMIERQGDKIDSIENHVSNAVDYVKAGVENTAKAQVYQSKARTKKLICYGVIAAAAVVILLSTVIPLVSGDKDKNK